MRSFAFGPLANCVLSTVALVASMSFPPSNGLSSTLHPIPCANTPKSRGCWGHHSIDTDYYEITPYTGVTREYWLNVQNTTLAPDGVERLTLNVNGTIPGPLITADWGDYLIIHVTNNLEYNGTSIHWHGMRLLNSNEYDGVGGVTQCPIAPGHTMTYKFRATEYGSTWYHSHYSLQYGDGLYGGIIINGPATANYDEDVGLLTLSDWAHESAFVLWHAAQTLGFPPTLENGLISGTNIYNSTGSRYETVFQRGKKYRIRIVNAALEAHFRFAIDKHTLKVIANDMVPIVPYTTDSVVISMGQRYDLIVEANQPIGNYWMRAIFEDSCNPNDNGNNIRGIVRYDANSTLDPTSTTHNYTDSCGDEPYASLIPHLPINPSRPNNNTELSTLELIGNYTTVLRWTLNSSALYVNWSDPTNLRIADHQPGFPTDYNAYRLPQVNQWVYWVIDDSSGFSPYHPMHLHGHDVSVLAQGNGTFSPSTVKLNFDNPPRRDTVTLAAGGYLVIAFRTDNPGSWLFHCHVAWHASEGFSVQFIEQEKDIVRTIGAGPLGSFRETCASWDQYWNGSQIYQEDDSGI